ncbi:MAG: T9SS type A sorting domain-containing protein [Flavobacteriia bacterium]|nr:T9SS type A sorting domain-containing protein [Flavobacteriia bacterium]
MKTITILVIFTVLTFNKKVFSQFVYSFGSSNVAYVALGAGSTNIGTALIGDYSQDINLGFIFNYGCNSYSQIDISEYGYLSFDNTDVSSNFANNLSPIANNRIIAPFWDQQNSNSNIIRYQTTGVAPNRIFTVEWDQMKINFPAASPCLTYQVKLYETSNIIEYRYKQEIGLFSVSGASIGISGDGGVFYSLDGTGVSPAVSTLISTNNILTKPASNQVYSFTPVMCSGMPNAGITTASINPTSCDGSMYSLLTCSGASTECGNSYQWQSSTDNIIWNNIIGATNTQYNTGIMTQSLYFRRIITCSFSGLSNTSNSLYVESQNVIPSNDECANATVIVPNPGSVCASFSSSTVACATASPEAGCPAPGNNDEDDVWFKFQATSNTHGVNIINSIGNTTDIYHSVYSGVCGALGAPISCMDDTSSFGGLTIGNWYYIRVHSKIFSTNPNTTFDICVQTLPTMTNDDCINAIPITVNPSTTCVTPTSGTVSGATPSSETNGCAGGPPTFDDDDVWYKFQASATSHTVSVSYVSGTTSSLFFSTYSGGCGVTISAPINCSSASPNGYAIMSPLTIGNWYYVRIYSQSTLGGQNSIFNICVTSPPENNDCSNAFSLTVNPSFDCITETSGSLYGASPSGEVNSCGVPHSSNDDDDIWYKFQATGSTHSISINDVSGSYLDLMHSTYSGTCGAGIGAAITCNDPNYSNLTGLTPGNWYYVRIYSQISSIIPFTTNFNVCITSPPPNDECLNAINSIVNVDNNCTSITEGSTAGATASIQAGCGAPGNGDDDDVWYRFTATSSTHNIGLNNIYGSTIDLYHSVYSGTCAAIGAPLYCSDLGTSASGLVIGNVYYIRVYTTVTTSQATWFELCISMPPPQPPVPINNQCSGIIQYCQQVPITINANTGTNAQVGNNYQCLSSQPNPFWYYLQASSDGNINLDLQGQFDTDFILYGPFNDLATLNSNCTTNNFGVPAGEVLDCSFSASNTEDINFVAQQGKFYALLITNYSNVVQTITLNFNPSSTGLCNCEGLPINLSYFVGSKIVNGNLLEWETNTELNNDYFIVQKYIDNLWQSIKFIEGKGNSLEKTHYSYADRIDFEKDTYYKLKQVDFDGKYGFSKILFIKGDKDDFLIEELTPNPVSDYVKFKLIFPYNTEINFDIIDLNGNVVLYKEEYCEKNNTLLFDVNVQNFNKGLYFMRFTYNDGNKIEMKKMVKIN